MRHILVDCARGLRRVKRSSGAPELRLDDVAVFSAERAEKLITVNSALKHLTAMDARKGKVFELRYFAGMSVDEAAAVLNASPATLARDWRMAKAWLRREIAAGGSQYGKPNDGSDAFLTS